MRVIDVLAPERVSVSGEAEGFVRNKKAALRRVAELLATGLSGLSAQAVFGVLDEREQLASTGVGEGIALPHGTVERLDRQRGALLVCPEAIAFDSIDGQPVSIIFGLVGPKGAPAEHLEVLARISRLLRRPAFRTKSGAAGTGAELFELIHAERGTHRGA